jgi:hypothetical protein
LTVSQSAWATLADARAAWRESTAVEDARLSSLLATATEVLVPYARQSDVLVSDLGDVTPAPHASARLTEACIAHGKDMWSVMTSSTGDVIGFDAYGVRRRPLSDHVKSLMRPETVPMVG